MDIEILGMEINIRVCLCGKRLLGLPSALRGKHSPNDNTILFVIHPAIVLHLTRGEIYYGTIGDGSASYLVIESWC